MKRFLAVALVSASLSTLMMGCNAFDFMDSPSGDAQILSAARACFDRGDLECAKGYYNQLSPSYANVATSETAFILLQEQGVSMAEFMAFVGDGADGIALTKLAEKLAPDAGEQKRLAIYESFKKRNDIVGDNNLKNFVQFTTSLALAAELLAEAASADNFLYKTDIIKNTGCVTVNCLIDANCGAPVGSAIQSASSLDIATTPPTGLPTIDHVYWAVKYAYEGLQSLGSGGTFSNTSGGLADIFLVGQPGGVAATEQCFRAQLIDFGIGK